MTLPLVSIVTPSLNSAAWITATIVSVLAQDYGRLEYIVMDGGSTDDTHAILRRFAERDNRLTWFAEPDTGISQAVNRGWARSQGEIIAWIGSDDLYRPGAVAEAVFALQAQPTVTAVYGDCAVIDAEGQWVGHLHTGPFDRGRLLGWNYLAQPAVFMRRAAVAQAGWLDESLRNVMDHDLWIKLAQQGAMAHVASMWAAVRVHDGTVTNRQVRRAGEETLRVVSRAVNDPALALDLQSQRARALAEAYLRAGMCFYAASDLPQARIYLKQALRLAPGLLADGRFLRTALTAQLGTRLIERLRRWRPAPHRTGSDRGV